MLLGITDQYATQTCRQHLPTHKRPVVFASERVDHYKYLGIWISSNLTWIKHIDSIYCKARRLLWFISRTFSPHCSPEAILALYKSQVLPFLEYGCVMWDPHLYKVSLLLDAGQNFALQIANWSRSCTDNIPCCELPSLENRHSYFKLLATFKFLNGLTFCPSGTFNYHPSPNPTLYHSKHLLQPFARACSFYNSFFIRCVKLGNNSPANVVQIESISYFKLLQRAFISNYLYFMPFISSSLILALATGTVFC